MTNDKATKKLIANRYQIEERIGQGGMGDVYKGVDTQTNEAVAIKQLKPDIVEYDPNLIERFEREGEALRRLNHPNIVKMLATVQEDEQHYLIMQYVPCGSLRDVLEETPQLPVDRVLAIGIELADALTRAHHLQIIHRDLKPANVLLDEDDTPLLTDFGVARIGTRTRVTETGAVIGTYAYLSPEACMGEPLDARADIWSFGVMLYEMLAGKRPFESDVPTAILLSILNNPLPDLTPLRPGDVPPALIELINKMLEKKREDRVSSVRMVGAALEMIREGGADTSLPPTLSSSTGSQVAVPKTPPADDEPLVRMGPPTGDHTLPVTPLTPDQYAPIPPTGQYPGQPTPPTNAYPPQTTPTGQYPPQYPGQPTPTGTYVPGYTPTPYPGQPTGNNMKWLAAIFGIVAVTAVVLLVILLMAGVLGDDDNPTQVANPTVGAAPTQPLPPGTAVAQGALPGPGGPAGGVTIPPGATLNTDEVIRVEPVDQGEYMVLVADLFPVGDVDDEVSDLIINDLTDHLEREIPNSNIRVRRYPSEISVGGDAQLIAIMNQAPLVVWGNYSDDVIELEIAMGVTVQYPELETAVFGGEYDRRTLENTIGVTVQLTDARRQSAAREVLGGLALLQTLNGGAIESVRLLAMMTELDVEDAEITSGGVSGNLYQGLALYYQDEEAAIEYFDRAIRLNEADPLGYVLRGATYLRLGETERALRDIETAERLGPKNWILPLYLRAVHTTAPDQLDEMIGYMDQVIAARPADWFAYSYRGQLRFLQGDYATARRDLEESIDLGAEANFPYLTLVSLALREGDLAGAQAYLNASLEKFPDPSLSMRMGTAFLGENDTIIGPLYAALGHLVLGQYDEVLNDVDLALKFENKIPELYMAQGIAYCGLGENEQAEIAYTQGIDLDPDFLVLHALRAEVLARQGRLTDAAADIKIVSESNLGLGLDTEALLDAALSGEWSCGDFFNFDYNKFRLESPDAGPSGESPSDDGPPDAGAASEFGPFARVRPVEPGEIMVLVARPEPVDVDADAERDIARFVAQDLTERLDRDIPYSYVRVRSYPEVITSTEEAQAVAQAAKAAVIVWGYYTPDYVELAIDIGSLADYPYIDFPRELLEDTANVRVRFENENTISLAEHIMNSVNVLASADGSELLFGLTFAMIDQIGSLPSGEVQGNSYASQLGRAILLAYDDPAATLDMLDDVVELDRGNPFGYLYRGSFYLMTGDADRYVSDMETARRLGSEDWSTMLAPYVLAIDPAALPLEAYDDMIRLRPDDWYFWYSRGFFGLLIGDDLAQARDDLAQSIALNPRNSSPYLAATLLALREGRIGDAQAYMATVFRDYPSPHEIQSFMNALTSYSGQEEPVGILYSAMTLVSLGQYEDAAAKLDSGVYGELADLYDVAGSAALADLSAMDQMFLADALVWAGLAQCNLGEYELAEEYYSVTLTINPDLPVAYMLRAQVRLDLDDTDGAEADWTQARDHDLDDAVFGPWLDLAEEGVLTCTTFFDAKLPGADGTDQDDD